MRSVPWWVLFSSVCAPILLIGGWSVSAQLHGPGYDPASATISVLAADGAGGPPPHVRRTVFSTQQGLGARDRRGKPGRG
ncbi:hypothetical protein ACWD63_22390, partial [Streptomyces clavifer]